MATTTPTHDGRSRWSFLKNEWIIIKYNFRFLIIFVLNLVFRHQIGINKNRITQTVITIILQRAGRGSEWLICTVPAPFVPQVVVGIVLLENYAMLCLSVYEGWFRLFCSCLAYCDGGTSFLLLFVIKIISISLLRFSLFLLWIPLICCVRACVCADSYSTMGGSCAGGQVQGGGRRRNL